MTAPTDKNDSETAKVETKAQEIVASESQPQASSSSEQPSLTKPAEEKSASNTVRRRKGRRITARNKASRRIRGTSPRSIYADESVPRVVYEDRYGNTARSRAYLKKALCLYSDRAQVFFENNYERVNMSLIVSTLVVEAIGGDKFAVQISETLEKKFATMEEEMMKAISELRRIANEKGIAEADQIPAYDHKRHYEPPLHTPQSAQFMTLVSLFDRFVARVEGAWINKVVSSQTRKALITAWEKRLIQFVLELHKLRMDSLKQAREVGFGARANAIDAQVRNEQKQKLTREDVKTTQDDNNPEKSS